jgi:hypothetical protein
MPVGKQNPPALQTQAKIERFCKKASTFSPNSIIPFLTHCAIAPYRTLAMRLRTLAREKPAALADFSGLSPIAHNVNHFITTIYSQTKRHLLRTGVLTQNQED